jgi:hypothetical protein
MGSTHVVGHHLAVSDDLLLALVRYAPLVFVVGGLLLVAWLAREGAVTDLQPDVLAALSETEALPPGRIRGRLPPERQAVDPEMLLNVLEDLRRAGLVVRWFEPAAADAPERHAVYRRLTQMVR